MISIRSNPPTTSAADNQAWENYFAAAGIQPYRVVYEQLVNSEEATLRELMRYLEIALPERLVLQKNRMKKQSDAVNEGWARRFTEELVQRSETERRKPKDERTQLEL